MNYKILKDKLLTNKFKHIIAADIASDVIRIAVVNCSKRINTVEKLIIKTAAAGIGSRRLYF